MKNWFIAFVVFAAVQAAAVPVPDMPHSFAIQMRDGSSGHGCAVNGVILTNRHMVELSSEKGETKRAFFRYEFPGGQVGRGESVSVSNRIDLATLKLDKDPPFGYARLGRKPVKDDLIKWVEYDFRKRKNAFKSRAREGKVVIAVAGEIIIDEPVTRGASGGCAYDERGEVVGLVTFGFGTADRKRGTGVPGFWGDWWADVPD